MIDPRKLKTKQVLVQILLIPGGPSDERPVYCESIVERSELESENPSLLSVRYMEPMLANALGILRDAPRHAESMCPTK